MEQAPPREPARHVGLTKPRLILRLGGLGNRNFGTENGIAESADDLYASGERACAVVLDAIAKHMENLLAEDQSGDNRHPHPADVHSCPRWQTHDLAQVFGPADRWQLHALAGESASVFAADNPRIDVLTGGAKGGDAIIRSVAQTMHQAKERRVDFATYCIAAAHPELEAACQLGEAPLGPDCESLGVGTNPEKLDAVEDRRGAGGKRPIAREDAAALATIARQRAYGFRAQSEALRHHSDLLLAIWDPDSEGKAGGTSESIASALSERLPVIAIRVGEGEEHAKIYILRSRHDLNRLQGGDLAEGATDNWEEELGNVLDDILEFPDATAGASGHGSGSTYRQRAVFDAFLRGIPFHPVWLSPLWVGFGKFAKARAERPKKILHALWVMLKEWIRVFERLDTTRPEKIVAQPDTYEFHYEAARQRASREDMNGVFGNAHRGGVIASYLLAACAVLVAVLGGILYHYKVPDLILAAVAFVELLILFLMYALSVVSKVEDWHEAYTDSRILAEALRNMRFLGPLGIHTPIPRLPYYLRGERKQKQPEGMWASWYFRALVRMAPLRLRANEKRDLSAVRDHLVDEWIGKQIEYHKKNEVRQEQLEHDIHHLSTWLFRLVLASVVLHIADALFGWHLMFVPTMLICVGGPALIAGLHGFASQIEISRLRHRSDSMVQLLEERASVLEALDLASDPAAAKSVWGLANETLVTARMMMEEAASWSMLYKNTDIHVG